ncbi:hypothetical protein [Halorientalis pallida]|uniref:Uncharacterized protein n=1 Tax=Halorientalis pallida TaxID=2479928 RepID=A0A498KY88_9EURY|nr:hypothetical protein [Halorientalis pallida]RXK49160.1 hypothetical protein EAF64_09550 [Halorientalis pallida]
MSVAPYDHYRVGSDAPVPAGVYRVVGLPDGSVTLLLVADENGHRRATGWIETVDRDVVDTFEPAENPDSGFDPRNLVEGIVLQFKLLYWKVR